MNNNQTRVVNIRSSQYDIYIGRAGRGQDGYFGNPFKLVCDTPESRIIILNKYKEYFDCKIANDPIFKDKIHQLKGKVLGCFCKPYACHGDIIANYLNTLTNV